MIGASESGGAAGASLLLTGLFGFLLYLLPSLIALWRKVPNAGSVLIVNFFLGWTFIGWIVALAMAFRDRAHPSVHVQTFVAQMPPQQTMHQLPSSLVAGNTTPIPLAGVAPGWYADPLGNSAHRYHDGNRWTDHVQ